MDKHNNWKNVMKNNLFLFKICYKTDRKFIVYFILESMRDHVNYFFEFAFGLNFILECAEFKRPVSYAITYLIFLFFLVSGGMLFAAWFHEKYKLKTLPVIKAKMKEMLFMKAKEVDLECYDNPEYYNGFILAISESDKQIDRLFELISKIVSSLTTFLLLGTFFAFQDVISLLFIVVMFVSSFIINQFANKLNFKIRVLKNLQERKRDYINRTFYLTDYAKELRINTKMANSLLDDFDEVNDNIYRIESENAKKRFFFDFTKNYVCNSFLHNVLYLIYLVYKAIVLRTLTYSNVVVLFKTSGRIKNSMNEFSSIYPFASETSMYVDKINHFLNTESKITNDVKNTLPEKPSVLELVQVCFSYSGDENYVLKDVNMRICIPNKVALVGFNGAGKTTLIKLIMRLYEVTKGEILLDGVNIKEYDLEDYRKKMGVIFQDYKLYASTLMENIILDKAEADNKEGVIGAIEKSGFSSRYNTLSMGLETNLTTEFEKDGVNLSGGESQKVALSRVFYKDNPMVILDEPSSALDPISEYYLNKSMLEIAENKLVLFISHRLSTTRLSDYIYVLVRGQIVESGTHEELLAQERVYASMWKAQAGHYI